MKLLTHYEIVTMSRAQLINEVLELQVQLAESRAVHSDLKSDLNIALEARFTQRSVAIAAGLWPIV